MKIVINKCYGGFSLSNEAAVMLCKLKDKKCYFFKDVSSDLKGKYVRITKKEADKDVFSVAFTVKNPTNKSFNKHYVDYRPSDRTDPDLIKVVKKLGKKANGRCADLKIIDIPDGMNYEIQEYDGIETVHEVHEVHEVHNCWG